MLLILYSFIIILLFIIALFSFPQFSPIPYFPSNKKDLKYIIKALTLKNNQVVIDLGAGDGIVIFEAAKKAFQKKLNTRFIAVEINPILLAILFVRRLFHPNRKHIRIVYGNIFTMSFDPLIHASISSVCFYLYISPWYLERTLNNMKRQFTHFSLVSYMYEVPSLKRIKKITGQKHDVFIYNI